MTEHAFFTCRYMEPPERARFCAVDGYGCDLRHANENLFMNVKFYTNASADAVKMVMPLAFGTHKYKLCIIHKFIIAHSEIRSRIARSEGVRAHLEASNKIIIIISDKCRREPKEERGETRYN